MLHTNFQDHRPFGSGEEDFLRYLLYIMGMAAILVIWPGPFEQTFVPPSHGGFIWNLTLRRTCLKSVDDVRRTTKAYLSYKLTKWAKNEKCSVIYRHILLQTDVRVSHARVDISKHQGNISMQKLPHHSCTYIVKSRNGFCLGWFLFYGPSTHFRSFRARSVNLATLFLGKPPRLFSST